MKNNFDCVVMKHQGAEKVYEKIAGFNLEKELKFWQECSAELRKKKLKSKKDKIQQVKDVIAA